MAAAVAEGRHSPVARNVCVKCRQWTEVAAHVVGAAGGAGIAAGGIYCPDCALAMGAIDKATFDRMKARQTQ